MISYLTVDRVEGNCAVCELELIDVENSKNIEYKDRETQMIDIMAYYLGDDRDHKTTEHQRRCTKGFYRRQFCIYFCGRGSGKQETCAVL